jgi:hypothetical protein
MLLLLLRALKPRLTGTCSTGKLLHAFGNVRAAQGKMDESLDFHNRALLQYKKFTVGKNHHRTADVCIKVADHYVRLNRYQGARFVSSFCLLFILSVVSGREFKSINVLYLQNTLRSSTQDLRRS